MAQHTHIVHGLVVGVHVACCGVPILLASLASLGALAGVGAIAGAAEALHETLHGFELWILAASAGFVALGAVLEWRLRRNGVRRAPWLFAASCLALVANAALIFSHAEPATPHMPAPQIEQSGGQSAPAPADARDNHAHSHDHGHHSHAHHNH